MRHVIVRYKVEPGRAGENEELVRAVYAELRETQPTGLRYGTLKLADGVSFVHVAQHAEDAGNPLTELPAFKRFQENILDRCDEPPVVSEVDEVGSYKLWA